MDEKAVRAWQEPVDAIIQRLQQFGTTISLATAHAVKNLAGLFKATLLSDLRAPANTDTLLLFARVVHAFLPLDNQLDEQPDEQSDEQLVDIAWSRGTALVYLDNQPFDTIMAAYKAFKENAEPHQQQQVTQLRSYLEEVLRSELQAIGAPLEESDHIKLLEEWGCVHEKRMGRNREEAHPLSGKFALEVLSTLEQAVDQDHVYVADIPTVVRLAVIRERDQVMKRRGQLERKARSAFAHI